MRERNFQSGNVLFLILIAVALFAALSYAVTSSTRSGGGDASKEKLITDLAQIQNYAVSLSTAVTRLMISNGCTDEQINATNPNWVLASNYVNPNAPSDGRCNLFSPAGGGVAWQKPPASSPSVDYGLTGVVGVTDIGGNTCDKTELTLITQVSREFCIAANEKLGNPTEVGGAPPSIADWNMTLPFTWASLGWHLQQSQPSQYGCGLHVGSHAGNFPALKGKPSACIYAPSLNSYFHYEVLLGR